MFSVPDTSLDLDPMTEDSRLSSLFTCLNTVNLLVTLLEFSYPKHQPSLLFSLESLVRDLFHKQSPVHPEKNDKISALKVATIEVGVKLNFRHIFL
jgi:hypothetical protein